MPLYEAKCGGCGAIHTLFRHHTRRNDPVMCAACGGAAAVIFSAPRVQNLSASRDTLMSIGRDLRVEPGRIDGEGLIREREAKQAALAREGAPAPRAATMEE